MIRHFIIICFNVAIVLCYTEGPLLQDVKESLENIHKLQRQREKDQLLVFMVDKDASDLQSDHESGFGYPIKKSYRAREALENKPKQKLLHGAATTKPLRNKQKNKKKDRRQNPKNKPLGMPDMGGSVEDRELLDELDKCHLCLGSCISLDDNMCTGVTCKDRMLLKYKKSCKLGCYKKYCAKALSKPEKINDYDDY